MKTLIYRATKTKLAAELERLGIDAEGSIDVLRRKVVLYIDANPRYVFPSQDEATAPETPSPMADRETSGPDRADPAKVMNQIRK